jgi:methionyl-tRNA formyltransferase
MLRVLLAGQKYFGAEVYRELRKLDAVEIVAVSAPMDDRLRAQADLYGTPTILAGTLKAETMPNGIDLIVAAHSHDFIGEKTRLRATYGGIGYHPSALPLHRGRDAVRWAVKMGDRITGGSVYRLSNRMDGGEILDQEFVFIRPGDDAETLWRRDLAPLGVRLLAETVARIAADGHVPGKPQDEEIATFEPSWERPPAYRPDLILLGCS